MRAAFERVGIQVTLPSGVDVVAVETLDDSALEEQALYNEAFDTAADGATDASGAS